MSDVSFLLGSFTFFAGAICGWLFALLVHVRTLGEIRQETAAMFIARQRDAEARRRIISEEEADRRLKAHNSQTSKTLLEKRISELAGIA